MHDPSFLFNTNFLKISLHFLSFSLHRDSHKGFVLATIITITHIMIATIQLSPLSPSLTPCLLPFNSHLRAVSAKVIIGSRRHLHSWLPASAKAGKNTVLLKCLKCFSEDILWFLFYQKLQQTEPFNQLLPNGNIPSA